MTALLSGEVDFFFNQSAPSIAAVKAGQVRALGVTTSKPLEALPGVPTVAEGCGLPGYESSTWYGLFGPAKLPADIQKRFSDAVIKEMSKPEFQRWLIDVQGVERKRRAWGQSVAVRVSLGGGRFIKKRNLIYDRANITT